MCRGKKLCLFHSSILTLQDPLTQIWMSCKKNAFTIIGKSMKKVCQIRGQVSQFFPEKGTFKRKDVVQVEIDKSSNDCETRSRVARSVDKSQQNRANARITRIGSRKTEARKCAQDERNFILLTRETKLGKRPLRMQEGSGRCIWKLARRKILATFCFQETVTGEEHPAKFRRQSTLV